MSKNSDFVATLKSIASNIQVGDKKAADVADSVNTWLKEGGEALKVKIEDEVERSVSKMGFIKRGEFEALKQEVEALKSGSKKPAAKKSVAKKTPAKKSAAKNAANKKAPAKKAASKSVKKATTKVKKAVSK